MLGRTHVSIGFLALTVISPPVVWPGVTHDKALLAFAASLVAVTVGSLAPDMDQPGSTLPRRVAGPFGANRIMSLIGGVGAIYLNSRYHISSYLNLAGIILLVMALIKHRGITHSIFGVLGAWYAIKALQGDPLYVHYVGFNIVHPFMVGYIAHICADFFSDHGIAPLYPIWKKHIRMPIVHIVTSGFLDKVFINYAAFLVGIMRAFKLSL